MKPTMTRGELRVIADTDHVQCGDAAAMANMLLAVMDIKPVAYAPKGHIERYLKGVNSGCWVYGHPTNDRDSALYDAPPAPAIPDHLELIDKGRLMMLERSHQTLLDYRADSVWYWQGDEDDQPEILSCPVIMSAETLRELLAKAAPPAHLPELAVWYGSMPESNGKTNWTAILHRKGKGRCFDGFTIDRSEYPGRVRYAADRVRYLIGELPERPHLLDYDGDEHSGYTAPPAPMALPDRERVRGDHAKWSQETFGNVGPIGPLKHLSKEALEAAADPGDLSEWADMQFLLWDAQRRAGITDEQITAALEEKLKVNMARHWPEPKDGEPRLHIKS